MMDRFVAITGQFWEFTVGNLLTMLAGVLSFLAFWWKVASERQRDTDRMEYLERRQAKADADFAELTKIALPTTVQQHERRLYELEQSRKQMESMATDINWIKEWLKENVGKHR